MGSQRPAPLAPPAGAPAEQPTRPRALRSLVLRAELTSLLRVPAPLAVHLQALAQQQRAALAQWATRASQLTLLTAQPRALRATTRAPDQFRARRPRAALDALYALPVHTLRAAPRVFARSARAAMRLSPAPRPAPCALRAPRSHLAALPARARLIRKPCTVTTPTLLVLAAHLVKRERNNARGTSVQTPVAIQMGMVEAAATASMASRSLAALIALARKAPSPPQDTVRMAALHALWATLRFRPSREARSISQPVHSARRDTTSPG